MGDPLKAPLKLRVRCALKQAWLLLPVLSACLIATVYGSRSHKIAGSIAGLFTIGMIAMCIRAAMRENPDLLKQFE